MNLWIFAYGSLIWRPDIDFVHVRPVSITGYRRSFGQSSHDHRGTRDAPGRVVTLIDAPDAVCHGLAYQLAASSATDTLEKLDFREKDGYERVAVTVHDRYRRALSAITWIASPGNPSWAGELSTQALADLILHRRGPSGANRDYVHELYLALESWNMPDPYGAELADLLTL